MGSVWFHSFNSWNPYRRECCTSVNDTEHFLGVKFSSDKSHKNCVISEIAAKCQVSSILSLSHVLAMRDAPEFMVGG